MALLRHSTRTAIRLTVLCGSILPIGEGQEDPGMTSMQIGRSDIEQTYR